MPRHERPDEVEKGYQGWRNYETWAVALWIDNEQSSQEYWREIAEECYEDAEPSSSFSKMERAELDLSKKLKEEFEEAEADVLEKAEAETSVWADLLGAALSEVYWMEIARNLLSDIGDEDDEEDEG